MHSIVLLEILIGICQPLELTWKVANPSCNNTSPCNCINHLNTFLLSIGSILISHCPRTREAVLSSKYNIRCKTLCPYLENKRVCLMSHNMFSNAGKTLNIAQTKINFNQVLWYIRIQVFNLCGFVFFHPKMFKGVQLCV